MAEYQANEGSRERRLEEVLAEYLRAPERGEAVDQTMLIRKYPELAEELASFFRNQSAMERMAGNVQAYELPTLDVSGSERIPVVGEMVRYFGDYELLEEIAHGGMGVVYKARQISLNRIVALKMILAGGLASKEDVRRFRAEAEAAAKLDHPNIVPIYEVGEYDGKQYFSMAFVNGGVLHDCMSSKAKEPKEAVSLMVRICRAVHFAHQRGILHRDLKPANILLDAGGGPQITDFGLAKQVDRDSRMTQSGTILGTPSYMAPEQARAERVLTTAADIYALGAILYELLTGKPPFRAGTPLETLRQVLEQEPTRPRAVNRGIDRDLETIALKCLEKEPDRRYESAAALADDLERWQRGEPIRAPPVLLPERAWKWLKRHPQTAALMGTGAALVLLIAIGGPLVKKREAWLQKELVARSEQAKASARMAEEAGKVADTEKLERAVADAERIKAQAERDAKEFAALQSNVESTLRRSRAIRLGEERGTPAEAKKLLSEAAALRKPMEELGKRLGAGAAVAAEGFWSKTWPQLNDEGRRWLSNSSLLLDRSMQLASSIPQPQNSVPMPNRADPRAHLLTLRTISPDFRWLARPGQSASEPRKQFIEIIPIETGTVEATFDITAPQTSGPQRRVVRSDFTPRFTSSDELLIAYREVANAGPRVEKHDLVIERRSVPSGEERGKVTIDLKVALVPSATAKLRFGPGTPASYLEPTIAFSHDQRRVMIFQPQRNPLSIGAMENRPAVAFDASNGEVLGKFLDPAFAPLISAANGDKLIGIRGARGNLDRSNSKLLLRNLATDEIENAYPLESLGWDLPQPESFAVSNDGKWVAQSGAGNLGYEQVTLVNLANGESQTAVLPREEQGMVYGDRTVRGVVAFSLDGKQLAAVSNRQVTLFSVPNMKVLHSKVHGLNRQSESSRNPNTETYRPAKALFTDEGRLAVVYSVQRQNSAGSEEFWQFWHADAAKIQTSPQFQAHQQTIGSARFFSDNQAAVISTGNRGFDAIDFSREERIVFQGPRGPEPYLSPAHRWLDSSGFWIASGFDSTGRWFVQGTEVWDIMEERQHRTFGNSYQLARSKDGHYLAMQVARPESAMQGVANLLRSAVGMAPSSRIQIWDLESDREACTFDSQLWSGHYPYLFTPDGKYFIGTGGEKEVVIGRVADGSTVGAVKGRYESHDHVPVDPSGTKLIVNDEDENRLPVVRVVELETARVLKTFSGMSDSYSNPRSKPIFSRNGTAVAQGNVHFSNEGRMEKAQVVIWSAENGMESQLDVGVAPESLTFGIDETRLIISGATTQTNRRRVLEIWDVPGKKRLATTADGEGSVMGTQVSSSVGTMAIWYQPSPNEGNVSRLELRDLATGEIKASFPKASVTGYAESGRLLILRDDGGAKLRVVEATSGEVKMESDDGVDSTMVSPNGRLMYVQTRTKSSLWQFGEWRQLPVGGVGNNASLEVRGVSFTPDSRQLVCRDQTTGVLSIWDTSDGQKIGTVEPSGTHTLPGGQVGADYTVQISPDGKTIAAMIQGQTRLFDIATGKQRVVFARASHSGGVLAVATSPDGRWVATAGADRTVGLWHAANGRFAAMLDGYAGSVCAVEFAPDSKQLLTRDAAGQLALWRLEAAGEEGLELRIVWQRKGPQPPANAAALAISPDGRQFACGSADGTVLVARLESGENEGTLGERVEGAARAVAYRGVGRILAAGGADGVVRLWDGATQKKLAEWPAGQGEVRSLAFQPGTELLVTASNEVRLWQTAPPRLVLNLSEADKPLRDICFSSDGRYLVTAGEDGIARRLDLQAQREALQELGLGW